MKTMNFLIFSLLLTIGACSHSLKSCCDKEKKCADGSCAKQEKKCCEGDSCKKK